MGVRALTKALSLSLSLPLFLGAQDLTIQPKLAVSGFKRPTSIAFPHDGTGRMFVTEQEGLIRIAREGAILPTPFLDLTDRSKMPDPGCCDERGLLSATFPADYADRPLIYVLYTAKDNTITLSRFHASPGDPNVGDPASEEKLFELPHPYDNHFGSALAFSPKNGMLYLSTGDGAGGGDPYQSGQDMTQNFAKILRFDISHDNYKPEIVATGLRNPWRFSFDRETGDLYIGDVGDNDWEEVDFIPADNTAVVNFGWSVLEGNHCLRKDCEGKSTEGMTPPIFEFSHAIGCSVTSGYVYRGTNTPEMVGTYLLADFCNATMWALKRDADGAWTNRIIREQDELNPSAFGEDERGELYFTDYVIGDIYQVTFAPKPADPAATRIVRRANSASAK